METAAGWVLQLGSACVWGGLWVAAAALLCRLAPRLPASVRAWLWWLACAKLLLGLSAVPPIALPVLAPPAPAARLAARIAPAPPATVTRIALAAPVPHEGHVAEEPAAPPAPAPPPPRWPRCLLAAWMLGVAASVLGTVRQGIALRRLRRGAVPAPLPGVDLTALAGRVGLRAAPRVFSAPGIHTPCVTGWRRPVILLPPGLARTLPAGELRLTLAHEMAHVKRGDLPLALVPALTRALLFFHPLAWWAAAEWAAAREEACDALALTATGLPRADYGRLLLLLAGPAATPPALGLSPGYRGLRRRLLGLARPQGTPRGARLLLLALPLLLPWRLTAASPAGARGGGAPARLYSVTALADGGAVAALNDAGQVTLSVPDGGGAQGYAGPAGALAALGALPRHRASLAYGINAHGQVAGTSFNILGHGRAFFWDGSPHRVGSLPGYPYSEARGLSDSGAVAGFAETGRADRNRAWVARAFLRQPGGSPMDLGTLGGPYSAAYGVNGLGVVVGKADTKAGGPTHAFAWAGGHMTDLGTLGGADSAAYAVSGGGTVVGASDVDASGTRHAFVYSDGRMRDLGALPGRRGSAAYAVSDSGQAVGVSQNVPGSRPGDRDGRATLWQDGRAADLNALLPPGSGWTLTVARAVNNHGQIAGSGLFYGKPRAFLLTPR